MACTAETFDGWIFCPGYQWPPLTSTMLTAYMTHIIPPGHNKQVVAVREFETADDPMTLLQ